MIERDPVLNCEQAVDLIGPFADDELNRDRAHALEVHLQNCPSCQNELNSIKKLKELIAFALEEEVRLADPGDLAQRVGKIIDSARPRRSIWSQPVWACAAIAFLVAIGFMVSQREPLLKWFGEKKNDAVVEEIQTPGTVLALWREPESRTTVIWLFDDQNVIQEGTRP
jgi:predicted anti-sigma-YlaC factor YlaD